uniref:Putative head-tail adaptor n=1 Tax=Variovorax sp. HH01 TaxID=1084736 RepID=I3PCP6_9BURK|nr:putative head-tail adaptor [Variovorax sp. HH01]
MTLAAGRLRHRVLIERKELARDSNGDVIQDPNTGDTQEVWVAVAEVYAAIEPLSAREFLAAQAVQSQVTARIVIRHRPDMVGALRLVHMVNGARGMVYNPAGFLPDKESGLEYLTSPVSAGVSDTGQ